MEEIIRRVLELRTKRIKEKQESQSVGIAKYEYPITSGIKLYVGHEEFAEMVSISDPSFRSYFNQEKNRFEFIGMDVYEVDDEKHLNLF